MPDPDDNRNLQMAHFVLARGGARRDGCSAPNCSSSSLPQEPNPGLGAFSSQLPDELPVCTQAASMTQAEDGHSTSDRAAVAPVRQPAPSALTSAAGPAAAKVRALGQTGPLEVTRHGSMCNALPCVCAAERLAHACTCNNTLRCVGLGGRTPEVPRPGQRPASPGDPAWASLGEPRWAFPGCRRAPPSHQPHQLPSAASRRNPSGRSQVPGTSFTPHLCRRRRITVQSVRHTI